MRSVCANVVIHIKTRTSSSAEPVRVSVVPG